ncbi:MAG: hypothetical protein EZS28_033753 [Streblomastix strix]|uniref:Uncharacterized protein n=1 Tax=Streblomastix strix TaxID=222440 RepID=A0A5J4UL34_9EUKA|nr:MAG: hypothetical protein EZS28_033753 [Streblomastix strix]
MLQTRQIHISTPQSNQSQQFVHKLVLGGGKDILTIQNGQIQSQHYETKYKLKQEIKAIKHTTAVVTTTSGSPVVMQLDIGIIKEVDDDDDFCLPNGNIQNAIKIPPKWQNLHQIQEDRMAFGVAHGITGSGELQIISVGHKLKEIIQVDWRSGNTKLFSSQQYSGKGNQEFVL